MQEKSKDKKVNNKGRELVKLGEIGGYILNGVGGRQGVYVYGSKKQFRNRLIVTNEKC